MPTALPVTEVSMNYASVVFVGFMAISAFWYAVYARKCEDPFYLHIIVGVSVADFLSTSLRRTPRL